MTDYFSATYCNKLVFPVSYSYPFCRLTANTACRVGQLYPHSHRNCCLVRRKFGASCWVHVAIFCLTADGSVLRMVGK